MQRWWVLWAVGCGVPSTDADPDTDGGWEPCPFGVSDIDPLAHAVDAMGPYNVGFRDWNVLYSPLPGEDRTIKVSVWYPTLDTEGDDVLYSDTVPGGAELGNAAPARPAFACGYPVMAYTHGDLAYGASSANLMRYMASHGWLAVAPDHTDNLLWADVEPEAQGHWYHRPRDVGAALDLLETLRRDDPLARHANTTRVLMAGHSRGASTVWGLAGASFDADRMDTICPDCSPEQLAVFDDLGDRRMAAFLPLAGGYRTSLYGETGHRQARGPWMLQSGGEDQRGADETFARVDTLDFTWLEFAGGCHQTFALGACGTLPAEEGFHLVNTYALAFGRQHILEDDDPTVAGLLDGSRLLSDKVRFARKGE